MATSIIKGGIESFTGTRSSALTGGACYGTYDNRTGLVTIFWTALADESIPSATVLYTIPSKYRPSAQRDGIAVGMSASSAISPGRCAVYSNGDLRQLVSNNRSSYFGMIQYTV